MKISNPRETIVLASFLVLANIGNCLYAALQIPPSGGFVLWYYLGIFWAIAAWTIADARRLRVEVPFDLGWFVFLVWPVAVPYHLFKTRGAKGFVPIAVFVAVCLGSYLVGLVVFYVVVANRTAAP